MDSPPRKIIHIDMDAFYASVEQRDDPSLKGKPLAVGHGARRGVVAAASYEARRFGVRSAMPSTTALRKCPQLVFVPPRFEVYKSVSRQIHEIFADFTDLIEPLSLDEAYLDVTADKAGVGSATETARQIRARILAETGLTASAGISYNKFLAKMASDQNKPNGQFLVAPGRGQAFVATLPIGRFYGVGEVTERKMKALDIETGEDLYNQTLDFLVHHFRNSGAWFYGIARGVDERPVNPDRERKSSGSETTFETDLTDPDLIETEIAALADKVFGWCEKTQAFGRTATVKIKYADFEQATRRRSLPNVIADATTLKGVAQDLVRSVYPLRAGVRLLGVTVSSFAPAPIEAQATLPV
ncbi:MULTISPECIES: DNA polymerase IV [unclassified Caulobacter]|jgi:DNA polymerase-4|uniref:DNA polymerase IV n=1 Tax=unclassified Caulobacter TaxID=2648921 RepID=UPI000785224D|nr:MULTISPECIES: DNA polymerase IV [unclassified Caulobacter]AZS21708.1 DNA polymerase IV [Caulobacter sp. FWC26]